MVIGTSGGAGHMSFFLGTLTFNKDIYLYA